MTTKLIPSARRTAPAFFVVLAAFALAVAGRAVAAPPKPASSAAFHVDVGYEDTAQAFEAESFFPKSLTVNVGDSVVFTMRSHEPHTITFNAPKPGPEPFVMDPSGLAGNPVLFLSSPPSAPGDPKAPVAQNVTFDGTGYVNSGFLQKPGDSLTVSFSAPGTYQVLCLLHSESMKDTIVVNPAGTVRPMRDADYRRAAASQAKDARARAVALFKSVAVPEPVTRPDGTRSYTVYAGVGSTDAGVDYMRYVGGERLSIKIGDSVTFDMAKNSNGVPHTITYLLRDDDPDFIIPEPQKDGPPKLLVNPKVLLPAPLPPAPYDGTAYYNSGLLLTKGPTPQAFTVTYTKAGTFKYQCIIHDEDGMKGTIIVRR